MSNDTHDTAPVVDAANLTDADTVDAVADVADVADANAVVDTDARAGAEPETGADAENNADAENGTDPVADTTDAADSDGSGPDAGADRPEGTGSPTGVTPAAGTAPVAAGAAPVALDLPRTAEALERYRRSALTWAGAGTTLLVVPPLLALLGDGFASAAPTVAGLGAAVLLGGAAGWARAGPGGCGGSSEPGRGPPTLRSPCSAGHGAPP